MTLVSKENSCLIIGIIDDDTNKRTECHASPRNTPLPSAEQLSFDHVGTDHAQWDTIPSSSYLALAFDYFPTTITTAATLLASGPKYFW